MIGARAQILQADDVGQIGKLACRLKSFHEFGKAFAIIEQHGRARRMTAHEFPCHGVEELFSDDLLRGRVARRQGARKAEEHIMVCNRNLAEHDFYVGMFYYKSKHYRAALERFKSVVTNYPDLGVHHKALKYIALSQEKLNAALGED